MNGTFGGDTFDEELDGDRLRRQLVKVYAIMADGQWHTLAQISHLIDAPEASVSARIRDLRKDKFGGHRVDAERVINGNGLFRYRMPLLGFNRNREPLSPSASEQSPPTSSSRSRPDDCPIPDLPPAREIASAGR